MMLNESSESISILLRFYTAPAELELIVAWREANFGLAMN